MAYLHGSAMLDDDLTRAGVDTAAAAFILVDKSGPGQDRADGSANLLAASLRLYVGEGGCCRHAPLVVGVPALHGGMTLHWVPWLPGSTRCCRCMLKWHAR